MRLLILITLIVGGLWLIAAVGGAQADVDRQGREMSRPLPQARLVYVEEARSMSEAESAMPVFADGWCPAVQ